MLINLKKDLIKIFGGFSLIGIVTTLISLALIFIFLKLLQTPLIATYIGIYMVTILLSYFLNSILVFKSNLTFVNGIKYLAVYLSGMLVGTLILWVFKRTIPLENYILGYLVLPFTMAWNFAFTYNLLKPAKSC